MNRIPYFILCSALFNMEAIDPSSCACSVFTGEAPRYFDCGHVLFINQLSRVRFRVCLWRYVFFFTCLSVSFCVLCYVFVSGLTLHAYLWKFMGFYLLRVCDLRSIPDLLIFLQERRRGTSTAATCCTPTALRSMSARMAAHALSANWTR